MTPLVAPLGASSGNTAAPDPEAVLKSELSEFLFAVAEKECPNSTRFRQTMAETIEGVIHLERHKIQWIEAVFSLRHVVNGDSLSTILGVGPERIVPLNHRDIRAALKIPIQVRESSLNLSIANYGEGSYTQAYAWIRAALFMTERRAESRRDALSAVWHRPDVF